MAHRRVAEALSFERDMQKRFIPVVVVMLAGLVPGAAARTAPGSAKTAPDVTWRSSDGATVRIADYKGRVVLVDFWASWCIPCKTSFPALDALFREYQPRGLDVFAVNLDERRKDADAFLAAHPHTMPVLFDAKGESPVAFGVKGMPTSYLIDRSGAVRFTHMGYTGNVEAAYRAEIAQLLSEH
jgi:peroxiredoxin